MKNDGFFPVKWRGHVLAAVLVVLMLIVTLAVGLLTAMRIERGTGAAAMSRERAEQFARIGLGEIGTKMCGEMANDHFVICQQEKGGIGGMETSYLFAANGRMTIDGAVEYRKIPLFSHKVLPGEITGGDLKLPPSSKLVSSERKVTLATLPWLSDRVDLEWKLVKDHAGKIIGRYAYWTEDLEARIDLQLAGNTAGEDGVHARAAPPFPAAGISDRNNMVSNAEQIAVFALDPGASEEQQGALQRELIKHRALLLSPGSVCGIAGIKPPTVRGADNRLVDPLARVLEENTWPGRDGYLETPVVPFSSGIAAAMSGKPKLNLNDLLEMPREDALETMAAHIRNCLPRFEARKGAFPDDYSKTLAANALDYADTDNEPTVKSGVRGLDVFPLVNEFIMLFRWDEVSKVNGRIQILVSFETFVELWNMTDKDVSGTMQVTCENDFLIVAGTESNAFEEAQIVSETEKRDGLIWHDPVSVSLAPNEHRVFRCGKVQFKMDVGPTGPNIEVKSIDFKVPERNGNVPTAGYRMEWNGKLVDESRGGVYRNGFELYLPGSSKYPNYFAKANLPGMSYRYPGVGSSRGREVNNPGDPRMSKYIRIGQAVNDYPGNYSPNRRNVRLESLYREDCHRIHGRVLPSEWPDGGHDAAIPGGFYTTSNRRLPDDARYFEKFSPALAEEAPMKISNAGRFYSAVELGRTYDPVQWETGEAGSGKRNPENKPWPLVEEGAIPSAARGGGNSLRIGRPEHPAFTAMGVPAWRLLDLFHAGNPGGNGREALVPRGGRLNLNTAGKPALRAAVYGALLMDPALAKRTADEHDAETMRPPPEKSRLDDAEISALADRISEAIIQTRREKPFATPAEILTAADGDGVVFGNRELISDGKKLQWNDAAAEELFGRLYEAGSVCSRNFRIWVIAQALETRISEVEYDARAPEVLAEVRKNYTVFIDPGERNTEGKIVPEHVKMRIRYENDF